MTADERDLLDEARDSLAAARLLLSTGYPGYAASRAYYAMFYVAEAFLENEGMAFSKHAAVIAAFGRHIAHAGKAPIELHAFLIDAQDARLQGDYGPRNAVSAGRAEELIHRAQRFLEVAEEHFGPIPPRDSIPPQTDDPA